MEKHLHECCHHHGYHAREQNCFSCHMKISDKQQHCSFYVGSTEKQAKQWAFLFPLKWKPFIHTSTALFRVNFWTVYHDKMKSLNLLVWMRVCGCSPKSDAKHSLERKVRMTQHFFVGSLNQGASIARDHLADESHGDQFDDLLAFHPASLYAWPLWSLHHNPFHTSRAHMSSFFFFFAACEKEASC